MKKGRNYVLYDIVNREYVNIPSGSIKVTCNRLGIDYTSLSKLDHKKSILNRYILSSARSMVFTLIDVETGIEYECVTNKSIFIHLNIPYTENDAKYIYELRRRRQGRATICGRLFTIKGGYQSKVTSKVKVLPDILKAELDDKRLRNKIKGNIYCRVRRAISDYAGGYKSNKTSTLIGCSIDSLKEYIQSKFTKNMGWHNRDLWHIDHITPCIKFDLKNPDEQAKCFHYTNMQPIWKTTDIAKMMGEEDYEGNQNKNDNGLEYDYFMAESIKNHFKGIISEKSARDISVSLFAKGIKKFSPEHLRSFN